MLQISTRLIAEEAARRGWHVEPLDERYLSTLAITTPDGRTHYFDSAQPPLNSAAAVIIADNKLATYLIAKKLDIPVAPFYMHDSANPQKSLEFLREQRSIVVKPIDTNHGDGITVGVTDEASLKEALAHAGRYSQRILLQRRVQGKDYRVLVVNGTVVAAARRDPAHVIGDGTQTIAELVIQKNAGPARAAGHHGSLSKIDVVAARRFLGDKYNSVPGQGEYVPVMATANLSKGGEAEDVTDTLHPEFAAAAERIANALGMYLCGADFLASDHTKPFTANNGILLEINATPGLRMHHYPSRGQARAVAAHILDGLVKNVTGTNSQKMVQTE